MIDAQQNQHRSILKKIARRAMLEKELLPEFSAAALAETGRITAPADCTGPALRDLRGLLWCSIDNDDSRDLDQLTVAEALAGGAVKIWVAIADVDALVKKGSAIDEHAKQNTTSVYTGAETFPMLPVKLSTDLTSLNFDSDRRSVVVEMVFGPDGALQKSDIYEAAVHNRAKLAYGGVGDWLENNGPMPQAVAAVAGLEENLRLQDRTAQSLKALRHLHGALDLETVEANPVFDEADRLLDLVSEKINRARNIIEEFMIAANGVTARYLKSKKFPSLRRVVRVPKRWSRIVEIAAERRQVLPEAPDPKALEQFLVSARAADPTGFPDLSLSIVKLLGSGEYVVEMPGTDVNGHFGLAVKDYTHSTAPNRRYPDLITQRLLKAALSASACPAPYNGGELELIARHCTQAEDAAQKVERQLRKSAAAMLLESRIGEKFDAIVTGASEKGTWVRLFHPAVEGRLESGAGFVDVGHRVRVQLVRTDVERGFIDFKKIAS